MKKVFSFLKPYKIAIGIALALMLTELTVELFQPIIMAKIVDDGILQNDLAVVLKWGSLLFGMSLIAFAAGIINSFYASHVSQSFGFDLRNALYEKIQSFTFANFNQFPTSSLITRMTNDVSQMQATLFMSLRIMLRAPLLMMGSIIAALFINVQLALILVILVPFMFAFLVWMMNKAWHKFQVVQEKVDAVNSKVREVLASMRLIKAFDRGRYEAKRFDDVAGSLKDQTASALRFMEIVMPILLFGMNAGIIVVLLFGSRFVEAGNVQVGEVVAIVNYGTRLTAVLGIFTWIIMVFARARASIDRTSDVLVADVNMEENIDARKVRLEGKIQFQHVSFSYPNTATSALQNISFVIEPGQTVAIIGATGSGKTSLFQLIPRLYDATKGQVLLDDKDVRDMTFKQVREQIGYVPQEPLLFSGTIRENLLWGKNDANLEEIMTAAMHAQIHDTIQNLPNQYDTIVGQRGVNLSGGQKQRLSIARALVRNPKILLLDDCTSALDLQTEKRLLKALKHYDCTTLIITQKISTAMNADYVMLLDEGQIVTQGHHNDLINESSLYKRIYTSQLGEEALAGYAQANN
ncbi:ABC transporter ATP-binding protein [Bacillus sp. HMF5848]|uniref:ABC transporter ATP-binding protein n=1 Tax=Bacillus sp. HMF5848 TaxID=2495421 RepID=UPI000F7A893E|nr:ABC transporter ATP-binding protein [Bacillus sp. HMF5848]RSK25973.1 ABC transporter ATP-binding protein [Bacillus sp. HMF5848]